MKDLEDRAMLRKRIAEALSRLVQERGAKQKWIAQALGRSENTVSHWLQGKRDITAVDLVRMCTALRVDPDEFLRALLDPESED